MSKLDDLQALGRMLDEGKIDRDEYDRLKADLMAESEPSSPASPMEGKPAGWYSDPSGKALHQAYWDGEQWTGQTRSQFQANVAQGKARSPDPRPFYRRPGFILLSLIVLVVAAGAVSSNLAGDEVEETFTDVASELDSGSGSSEDAEGPTPTTAGLGSQFTRSEENAIRSAESYLSFSAFSRSGLIDQLEFEGFTTDEATLAVEYLEVDWNRQAALSAENYLETSAFSELGLIDQLEFEGFTSDQATRGVNSITVDWNEQAWKSAESYLEFSSFSRSGLIDQLLFEGFTRSQATYAADKAGL